MRRRGRALRRRYGRAAAGPGWASGRRPSHSEIWSNGKPIAIRKSGSQWALYVLGGPVVRGSDGGLLVPGRTDYDSGLPIAKFKKEEAKFLAHKIGHYMLGLGDFVTSYVEGY
jgi:hypothetical protein